MSGHPFHSPVIKHVSTIGLVKTNTNCHEYLKSIQTTKLQTEQSIINRASTNSTEPEGRSTLKSLWALGPESEFKPGGCGVGVGVEEREITSLDRRIKTDCGASTDYCGLYSRVNTWLERDQTFISISQVKNERLHTANCSHVSRAWCTGKSLNLTKRTNNSLNK